MLKMVSRICCCWPAMASGPLASAGGKSWSDGYRYGRVELVQGRIALLEVVRGVNTRKGKVEMQKYSWWWRRARACVEESHGRQGSASGSFPPRRRHPPMTKTRQQSVQYLRAATNTLDIANLTQIFREAHVWLCGSRATSKSNSAAPLLSPTPSSSIRSTPRL